MRARAFGRWFVLGGLAAGMAVWACQATPPADGESDSAETSFTGDHTFALGTCTIAELPADMAEAMDQEPTSSVVRVHQSMPAPEQVLTKVELSAIIGVVDGKRALKAINANVNRGQSTGTVTFQPGFSAMEDTIDLLPVVPRAYSRRAWTSKADGGSTISLGDETKPINTLVLQWESTGEEWALFGNGERIDAALVSSAPHCDFDVAAWKTVKNVACEGELYDADGGTKSDISNSAPVDCKEAPKDVFKDFAYSLDAGHIVSVFDAGNPVDAGNDADAGDGGLLEPVRRDAGKRPDAGDDDDVTDEGGAYVQPWDPANYYTNPLPIGDALRDPNEDPDAGGAPKAKKDSGCSVSHGQSDASEGLLAFGLLGLVFVRRRRA